MDGQPKKPSEENHSAENYPPKQKMRLADVLSLITAGFTLIMAILTFVLLVIARNQFKETQKASEELTGRLERLSSVMGEVEEGVGDLDTTLSSFNDEMAVTLNEFSGELKPTLENMRQYLNAYYEQLLEAESAQAVVLSNLFQQQEVISRDLERAPLILVLANDVRVEPYDSVGIDSLLSFNFEYANLGDRTTEDVRALITLPSGYKIVKSAGAVRVMLDSSKCITYYPERLYWGDPDGAYTSASNDRIYITNTGGLLSESLPVKASIYTSERQPYEHQFRVDRANSQRYFPNDFIRQEITKIRQRQTARPR